MTLEHIKRYSTYSKLFLKMIRIRSLKKLSLRVSSRKAFMHNGSLNWNDFHMGVLIIFSHMKNAYTINSIIPFPEILSFRNV